VEEGTIMQERAKMPDDRLAQTSVPIHDLMARRWSPRAYDASKPVSREQLRTLLEAGRWAPSCNGDEPWRYLIWDRKGDPEGFQKAFDCLSENNKKWVKNVPLLMLSCAGSNFEATGKPNRYTQHDTGAATVCMALQAAALGLVIHQMVAVGYQAASPDILDDETKAKELRPRRRKPLAERFFEGGWGKGVQF
jgi:nitroreductase